MNKKVYVNVLVMGVIVVLMIAGFVFYGSSCGGSSSSGDTPEITSISSLPKATSPMASASASASISAAKGVLKGNGATTGLNIRTTTSSSFSYLSSIGACNNFNTLKQAIGSASQADMIMCYVSNMNSAFVSTAGDVDIYDGNYHIFNLNVTGGGEDGGAPARVKMKITKDSNGSITDFRMWMCSLNPSTGALFQNEYTEQIISGVDLSMTALGMFSSSQSSGRHYVNVSGKLNTSRAYTEKTITTKDWNMETGSTTPNHWAEAIMVQTPATFQVSGYNKGSWSDGGNLGTYEDKSTGLGEMLGDTGGLTTLAMGDGAVKYSQSGTCTQCGDSGYSQSGVNAWNGDTTAPEAAATNDYYSTASGYTYSTPTVQSAAPSIEFSADQTWNCEDDVGVGILDMPQTTETAMATGCEAYTFDHNWINCYDKIGQCNGDNYCQNFSAETKSGCQACFTDGVARNADTVTCLKAICNYEGCTANVDTMCPAL